MVWVHQRVIVTYGKLKQVLYPYESSAGMSFWINSGKSPENCIDVDQESIQAIIDAVPFGIPFDAVPFINGERADSKTVWHSGDRIEFRDADAASTPDQCDSDQDEKEVSPTETPPVAEDLQEHGGLTIDPGTFTATYKGKSCELGNTRAFHLLVRLNRTVGIYLSISTLIQDVWLGKPVSDEAVQKQVSILGIALRDAGMEGVVLDGGQPAHYRLILK